MEAKDQEILDALCRYIQAEIDGHRFYMLAAERTDDPKGREMFESLARDEVRHRGKLEAQYGVLLEGGCWLSADELEGARKEREGRPSPFARASDEIDARIEACSGDLDALAIGIEMEKESYSAYTQAAEKATSTEAAALFRELAKEESGHLRLLENTRSYLAETGSWFLAREKGPMEP